MFTIKRMFVVASLSVLVLVPVSTVHALTITSGNTVVLQDDFEGATGNINGRVPPIGVDPWVASAGGASSTDIETSPPAFQGSNFLSLRRPGGGSGQAIAEVALISSSNETSIPMVTLFEPTQVIPFPTTGTGIRCSWCTQEIPQR